jgi:single-stranded DNA-binding protein
MIATLVTGALFRSAESRMAKSGRAYLKATLKEGAGDEVRWINITCFSDIASAELLRLTDGDCLSVQGPLTANIYTANDGTAKLGLSIVANHVLALRQLPKERKAKAQEPAPQDTRSRQQRLTGSWQSAADGPNDDIPFGGAL